MLGDPYFAGVVIGRAEWEDPILEYPEAVARLYDIPLISMVIFSAGGIHQLVHVKEKDLDKRKFVRIMNSSSFEDAWRHIYYCVSHTELLVNAFFGETNECSTLFSFHLVAINHLRDEYYGMTVMTYE